MGGTRFKGLTFLVFSFLLLGMTQCTRKAVDLPKDLLGIYIGMNREDAQKRLEEIATLESEARKTGQLWRLKDNPHFSHIAIDYNKENKVRYVTTLVEKVGAKERVRFTDVGDLAKAKAEILEPHYRYIWQVPADGERESYHVNVYGDNPEFVTIYTLEGKSDEEKPKEKSK